MRKAATMIMVAFLSGCWGAGDVVDPQETERVAGLCERATECAQECETLHPAGGHDISNSTFVAWLDCYEVAFSSCRETGACIEDLSACMPSYPVTQCLESCSLRVADVYPGNVKHVPTWTPYSVCAVIDPSGARPVNMLGIDCETEQAMCLDHWLDD